MVDVISKGLDKSISDVTNYFKKAHFTKLEAMYVDVKEGKILDPNIRIEKSQANGAIESIEKVLSFLNQIINLEDERFIKMMKDEIFSHLFKIDFD